MEVWQMDTKRYMLMEMGHCELTNYIDRLYTDLHAGNMNYSLMLSADTVDMPSPLQQYLSHADRNGFQMIG